MAMPYIVSIIYSELYWCLLRTHDYIISSLTKCCHLNGYDFIKHCLLISFDMFVNINKYLYILYIFACYLFYCFCIYSRTLAHVATVICWLYPTLNKFYLILSYLIAYIYIHPPRKDKRDTGRDFNMLPRFNPQLRQTRPSILHGFGVVSWDRIECINTMNPLLNSNI